MKSFFLLFVLIIVHEASGQGIGINTTNTTPHPSALLDVQSSSKGVLLPRMTMMDRDLIGTPAVGLLIYQTDVMPGLYMYDGGGWQALSTSANVWSTTGNSNMSPMNHFIGTTDTMPLLFRVNNKWVGAIDSDSKNIFFGDSAGITLPVFNNIGIGAGCFRESIYAENSVAIGVGALQRSNASYTVAIGSYALNHHQIGTGNCAIGHRAMYANTHGQNNVAIGSYTLYNNTVGIENIGIGPYALFENSIGNNNVAIGFESLALNDIGYDNTAIGNSAMFYNEEGIGNTAVGRAALQNLTEDYNTAIGYRSMFSTSIGRKNVAIGAEALEFHTTSDHNVAVGMSALRVSNGDGCTAVGYLALVDNVGGHYNTAVGHLSASQTVSGLYNTAIGKDALRYNNSGSYNIALGAFSGTHSNFTNLYNTVGISNTDILHQAQNQVVIGNTAHTWIGGPEPWSVFSDARIKRDVQEDVQGIEFIKRLRPVTYYRDIDLQVALTGNTPMEDFPQKYNAEQRRISGFLAQEVEAAATASDFDFSGIHKPVNDHGLYSLSYECFVVPLVKAVQEQQALIEQQQLKSQQLDQRLLILEALVQKEKP